MKRQISILLTLGLLIVVNMAVAQTKMKRHVIMFYNVENLFDTIRDPRIYDEEFTPDGAKAWTGDKYWKKIANIEEVISKLAAETRFPAIIGVSEVENRNVLEDIAAAPKLARANYQIVHHDSPDARGVDVAMFYRPDIFELEGSEALPVLMEDLPKFRTRDVLMSWGRIDGELFYFFVNHWPSRGGGQKASEPKRVRAAEVVKQAVDSVLRISPEAKIVIMGDLNDDPTDASMFEVLGASGKASKVQPGQLFNPFLEMFRKGYGTLAYQGQWNLFDNIIIDYNLLNGSDGGFRIYKGDYKYYGFIFDRAFLRTKSGQYKDYPFRTFSGNTFLNGYSDHFPVYIFIAK